MTDVAKLPLSNMAQRIITAAVVGPIVVVAVLAGELAFTVVVSLFALVGVLEFYTLARNRPSQGSALIGAPMLIAVIAAFHVHEPLLWVGALAVGAVATFVLETLRHRNDVRRSLFQVGMTLAGCLYLGFPAGFLVALRGLADGGVWILLLLCVTWATDSFAYVGGRLWGTTKLAPRLSPKKTREGAVVGVIGGIAASLILVMATGKFSTAPAILVFLGPSVAIVGDLAESALKRYFEVKDSHIAGLDLLPGHGGILDRTDSLLLVATFAYIVFALFGLTK